MHRTMFNTPIIRQILKGASTLVLKLTGWKVEGEYPKELKKAMIIAAPHTSNWDMPFSLMMAFKLQLPVYWLGKKSIFKFPFGPLMRWMGGIAVERSRSTNMVDSMVEHFNQEQELLLMMSPEGTRAEVKEWKSGFYFMANGANIPIVLGYIDYPNKRGGIGPVFTPTGDYKNDLIAIQAYYQQYRGKS